MRAALEGFYGPPFSPSDRLDLVAWLPSAGLDTYLYSPKDDPWHRERWREPYPAAQLEHFAALADACRAAGVELGMALSPGLDWRPGDEDALAAKLRVFADLGVRLLTVAFDDIPPGGRELGRAHGDAVAAAARALPDDVRWCVVPVDYAVAEPTAYLRGLAAALPTEAAIGWSGTAIVPPEVHADDAERLAQALGRPLFFGDNWPVADGGMAGVAHLGPYPVRDPRLAEVTSGIAFNVMSKPLATRPGLAVAARAWRDPHEDREHAWRETVATFPGLEPLARACRSWLTAPGPDPELAAWLDAAFDGDDRLGAFLAAGPDAGLPEPWRIELAEWIAAWWWEAVVTALAIHAPRQPRARWGELGMMIAEGWRRLQHLEPQVFGIRRAVYPVTTREGDDLRFDPAGVVRGRNLTDLACERSLARMTTGRA